MKYLNYCMWNDVMVKVTDCTIAYDKSHWLSCYLCILGEAGL